ncbi:MAG: serpin family protein [Duncaniella sp.]|nr:serpin family protein [Duncaniella sp.]
MRTHYLFSIFVGLLCWGCSSDEPRNKGKDEFDPISLSRNQQEIVDAQNAFAIRLFSKVANENTVISPLSVSLALSMTANGAEGKTYTEICDALGYEGATIEEVNTLNRTLIDRLPTADSKTTVAIANSLWINNEHPILNSFKSSIEKIYDANISNLDLYSTKSMSAINEWISKKTCGVFDNFLSSPLRCEAALINTLYFKSVWGAPINKSLTKPEPFYLENGSETKVNMMQTSCTGIIYDDASVIRKDYGNSAFYLCAVMPPEGTTLSEYITALTPDMIKHWNEILTGKSDIGYSEVELGFPKFNITSEFDLIPVLKSLGVESAFSPAADFSKLSETALFISEMKQQARFEIDEDGVVASAVTSESFDDNYCPGIIIPTKKIIFNRPFIYMVVERSTGAILYIGGASNIGL